VSQQHQHKKQTKKYRCLDLKSMIGSLLHVSSM